MVLILSTGTILPSPEEDVNLMARQGVILFISFFAPRYLDKLCL
jgi:hypothetical protein